MSVPGGSIEGASQAVSGSPLALGQVIAGKYRIERQIGSGGMGIVLAATHLQLERTVAIKVVRRDLLEDERSLNRLLAEARAAAKIRSEHVARVLDVGTLDGGSPFIVMEYLDGEDLAAVLDRTGPFAEQQAVHFMLQACEALAEVHVAEMVHRDLKPGNLFIARRPDGSPTMKIVDFGISKYVGGPARERAATTSPQVLGSPFYMAPEQMRAEAVDARSDIWALGAILFEMLTGKTPFQGDTLPEVYASVLGDEPPSLEAFAPDVAPGLDDVVQRCLAKDPAQRFCDVAELAEALAAFGGSSSTETVERVTRILTNPELLAERPSLEPCATEQAGTDPLDVVALPLPPGTSPANEPSTPPGAAGVIAAWEGAPGVGAVRPLADTGPRSSQPRPAGLDPSGLIEGAAESPAARASAPTSRWAWLAVALSGLLLAGVLLARGYAAGPTEVTVNELPRVGGQAEPSHGERSSSTPGAATNAVPGDGASGQPAIGSAVETTVKTVGVGDRPEGEPPSGRSSQLRTTRRALLPSSATRRNPEPTISVKRFREAVAQEKQALREERRKRRSEKAEDEAPPRRLAPRRSTPTRSATGSVTGSAPTRSATRSAPRGAAPASEGSPPIADPWDPVSFGERR